MQLCFPWHVKLTSGVAEYLFRSRDRIEKAINAGLNDKVFRADDLEFTVAARQWGECVSFGNFDLYERRFMDTASEYNFASAISLSALQLFPEAARCVASSVPLDSLFGVRQIYSSLSVLFTGFATRSPRAARQRRSTCVRPGHRRRAVVTTATVCHSRAVSRSMPARCVARDPCWELAATPPPAMRDLSSCHTYRLKGISRRRLSTEPTRGHRADQRSRGRRCHTRCSSRGGGNL